MLAVIGVVFVLAAVALALGMRGRRVDDHPICRKCGFDLVGSYPERKICPECGRSLDRIGRFMAAAPIRVGNRRRRRREIAAASACMALTVVVGSFVAWDIFAGSSWNSYKPTWWLMLDTRSRAPATVEAALSELQTRQTHKRLSKDQWATLVERGLACQADESLTWINRWGDLIEAEWLQGDLTEEQQTSYAAHAVSLQLNARARVRQGDQVAAALSLESRVGSTGLLSFELKLHSMKLGDQELLGSPFNAEGTLNRVRSPGIPDIVFDFAPEHENPMLEGFPRATYQTRDATITATPGRYSIKTNWHVRIREQSKGAPAMGGYSYHRGSDDFAFDRPSSSKALFERDLELTAPVEVVPPTATTVELLKDEGLAEVVRSAVQVSVVDEAAQPYSPAGRRMTFRITDAPVDLAFDVTVRSGEREWHSSLTHKAEKAGFAFSYVDLPGGGKDAVYDVILTPSPDRASRTVGMTRIWGLPVVYEQLAVQRISQRSSAAQNNAGVQVMATLRLPPADRFGGGDHAFRSVALRMPVVYVGDRMGDLYIFEVDENDENESKDAVKVIKNVGDGNDLKVVGDVLLCTKSGRLAVYSLKNPVGPEYLGTFGPESASRCESIVISGGTAFLLGAQRIVCYDVHDPAKPQLISIAKPAQWPRAGCVQDHYLYAAEMDPSARESTIGVYDISALSNIRRVSSIATPQSAYAIHFLTGDRILAALDSDSLTLSGPGPHGATLILDVRDPTNPEIVAEIPDTSGRVSALLGASPVQYLVCPGAVMRLEGDSLTNIFPLYTGASNLDGAAYHGDADATHAALAMDSVAVVIRIPPADGSSKDK